MRTTGFKTAVVAAFATVAMLVSGCVSGEGENASGGGSDGDSVTGQVLNIDFATYNPLSLIIKKQRWLEDSGVDVNWVQSAGSNKANEALRAGAIDVGSTAGSAALLARSNGSPIKVIAIYSQPEWAALVAPKGSTITTVEQLRGKSVAATKGTDPYFFLPRPWNRTASPPRTSPCRTCSTPTGGLPCRTVRSTRGPVSTRSWRAPSKRVPPSSTATSS